MKLQENSFGTNKLVVNQVGVNTVFQDRRHADNTHWFKKSFNNSASVISPMGYKGKCGLFWRSLNFEDDVRKGKQVYPQDIFCFGVLVFVMLDWMKPKWDFFSGSYTGILIRIEKLRY